MTVDYTSPLPTGSLISEKKPSLYPISIPRQHHQLKNFISTRHKDYIYYAVRTEIYSLHLPTNKRRLVTRLKWKPLCLDAAHDWICVGAGGPESKGLCAFIEIKRGPDGSSDGSPSYLPPLRAAEVDDLLPLDLDPDPRALYQQRSSSARSASLHPTTYEVHENVVGDDIVNSVVIQRMPGGRNGLADQTVVLMTNNDQTVRIFSLSNMEELNGPESYPTAMNHATLSPDGNLLVAVGDKPQVFFHRRVFKQISREGKPGWAWEWEELCQPGLSLAQKEDCYFCSAFSPSSHVCAVASQMGVITVFDTAAIREDMDHDDAVIGILKSSRSNISAGFRGAIRSMSFSPGPWDLLAIMEEQGRVNVVDLRNALLSAQLVHLEPNAPHIPRVEIQDPESTFDQRQLEIERRFLETHDEALAAQDFLSAVSNTADNMEYAANRRRTYRESISNELTSLRSDPHRLTQDEQQMFDALSQRRARRRNNNNNNDPSAPLSIHYSNSSNRYLPPTPPWEASASPSSNSARHTASIAEYMRLRNNERSRASGERFFHPRRRSSVVVSNSNPANASSPNSSTLAPIGTGSQALSASPSRLPSSTNDSTLTSLEQSWQTISNAMNENNDAITRARRTDPSSTTFRDPDLRHSNSIAESTNQLRQLSTLHQLASRNEQQRQINLMNAQRLSILRAHPRTGEAGEENNITSLTNPLQRVNREDGVVTMGVGWSSDGRELYVATEEGILQYKVNTQMRQQFPGMAWL